MSAQVAIPPRVIRYYSTEERASTLAIYDQVGSLEKTSEITGIPKSTIHGWIANPDYVSNLRTEKALTLAKKFDNAANLFLDLAVKKAKKANFNHLMTGAGIAVDKSQLLNGLPTNITEVIDRSELTLILQSSVGLDESTAIDITPEPVTDVTPE